MKMNAYEIVKKRDSLSEAIRTIRDDMPELPELRSSDGDRLLTYVIRGSKPSNSDSVYICIPCVLYLDIDDARRLAHTILSWFPDCRGLDYGEQTDTD